MSKKTQLEWRDITIGQYLNIQKIINNDDILQENKLPELIQVIWPEIDADEITIAESLQYMQQIDHLMKKTLKNETVDTVKQVYLEGFGKCVVTEMDKMTLSQFIDYQYYSSQSDENIVELLSVCIVPADKKYNLHYDIHELQNEIEKLPVTYVYGILDFFVKGLKRLLKTFLISLGKQIMRIQIPLREKISMMFRMTNLVDILSSRSDIRK